MPCPICFWVTSPAQPTEACAVEILLSFLAGLGSGPSGGKAEAWRRASTARSPETSVSHRVGPPEPPGTASCGDLQGRLSWAEPRLTLRGSTQQPHGPRVSPQKLQGFQVPPRRDTQRVSGSSTGAVTFQSPSLPEAPTLLQIAVMPSVSTKAEGATPPKQTEAQPGHLPQEASPEPAVRPQCHRPPCAHSSP